MTPHTHNVLLVLCAFAQAILFHVSPTAQAQAARNPIIFADVPDMAMIRVGDTYYMSSTTMHMSPGLPIMRSNDLVHWELASYAYDILEDSDALSLRNGKNAYGAGTWASSLRHHQGTYYATTFSGTTGKTYVFSTNDIEQGTWKRNAFAPSFHDHSLFFDDDGRVYLVFGAGTIRLVELTKAADGVLAGGLNQVLIEDPGALAPGPRGLSAEGSQLFKVNGKYYLFHITWPRGGMRTVLIHRADKITGPYEGRVALQDQGVAQGGLIDTPDGRWFAYLFQDHGAVGRIPYLVPVQWEDGWPVLGVDGKVPLELDLPSAGDHQVPAIVASDEFDRKPGEPILPLVWQWNHNPDPAFWSLTDRPGFLRLTTGRIDKEVLTARNTLTQRTFGPRCTAETALDVSGMQPGDHAGLILLQQHYALLGVRCAEGGKSLVMTSTPADKPVVHETVELAQDTVYLRAECDFTDRRDMARFFYSLDGRTWKPVGAEFKMRYTLPHFMGYRFGLFNHATQSTGGHVDFDFFHIGNPSER